MNSHSTAELATLPRSASVEEILSIVGRDGGAVIERFLTSDQVDRLNSELQPHLDLLEPGSRHQNADIAAFHGRNTKRLTNLVANCETFRNEVLPDPLAESIADAMFMAESGTYWMGTAQVIEIGPGSAAQLLHRDLANYPPFVMLGPDGPEAMINFLVALTDFTEENGATRVIPGSNTWSDYTNCGSPYMTIPAEMSAGDALLISGRVVHGGGANTTGKSRRGLAWTFNLGYLVPEEAYPFMADIELVRTLPSRVQRLIGFRSQYPVNHPGLWQWDYDELADRLGL
ncbi:phytanoyl-CoA dioxygenase family protein [Nocardia sp. NPDC059239]|uniref:phytanoyl-CoA dioxygenase family protein n=1 Tax=unclassified Nocardia TaxID=2637762 RepID=UPI00367527A7